MREYEKVIPYQNTKKHEENVYKKYKELLDTGFLHIYGCIALKYENNKFYISCHPHTEWTEVSNINIVNVLISLSDITEHLVKHVELKIEMGRCPECEE